MWEYLVHRQFIAEKFSPCDIDASFARRFSDSIILDNRCPHAGDRWPRRASSLYWWHFYGFQRNIALQELEMTVGFWARGDACLTPPPSTGTPKAAGGAAVTVRCTFRRAEYKRIPQVKGWHPWPVGRELTAITRAHGRVMAPAVAAWPCCLRSIRTPRSRRIP